MLCADSTVPEREIVELLGCEGKLPRATRIYAKHDPARLSNVTRALTTIGTDVHRAAKAFGAVHLLPTEGQGGKNGAIFTEKTIKSLT